MGKTLSCGTKTVLSAAILLLVLTGPVTAQDGECESDTECGQGRICEAVGWIGCPGSPPCDEGPDGTFDCPAPPPCETREFSQCVPGPCTEESDCADGERCVTETWTQCDSWATEPACEPIEEGSEDEPECESLDPEPIDFEEDCETITKSTCKPRWQGPCEQGSDCGPGFTCEPSQICWCTGSAPSMTPPGGTGNAEGASDGAQGGEDDGDAEGEPDVHEDAPQIDGDPNCGCEEAEESYCRLIDAPCETDSDCDESLTCQEWGVSAGGCAMVPASTTRPPMQGSAGMPAEDPIGDRDEAGDETGDDPPAAVDPPIPTEPTDPWVCEEVEPVVERRCIPPNYWGVPGGAPTVGQGMGTTTGSSGGEAAPDPTNDTGSPNGGDGMGAEPPRQDAPGSQMPNADDGDADKADSNDREHRHGKHKRRHPRWRPWLGCSMSPGTTGGSGLALLLGVPALVLLRRRDRRHVR